MLVSNEQSAPYPQELADMVAKCKYKKNWRVYLETEERGQGCFGLTLSIVAYVPNSLDAENNIGVRHLFPVPAAAYDYRSWRRWLFECFHQVELHECMEFFEIEGARPYAPSHGPGNDPYMVRETGTAEDQLQNNQGEIRAKKDDSPRT